jgi:hypothetical protein
VARVRVRESHRIVERRGKVGKVLDRYGGEDYVAVDVRFPEGGERLFWPRDLEEVSPAPPSWWRSLLKGIAKRCTKKATSWKTYTYGQREPVVQPATLGIVVIVRSWCFSLVGKGGEKEL